MLSPRSITFFVCTGVSSLHAVALRSFINDCICLVWSWIDARELSQLWFSLLMLLVELPFMFLLAILLPFVLLLFVLLSVRKSFLLFSIDSVISLIDSNEWSTSGQRKSIFSLRFLTKIWFPLLREVLWEWCCKFVNNDSVINWLSLIRFSLQGYWFYIPW